MRFYKCYGLLCSGSAPQPRSARACESFVGLKADERFCCEGKVAYIYCTACVAATFDKTRGRFRHT